MTSAHTYQKQRSFLQKGASFSTNQSVPFREKQRSFSPRRIEYAGANVDGASVDYDSKYSALQQTIKDRYAAFKVEYYGKDNDDYVNGQGFCCADLPANAPMRAPAANDNPELFQYYYHSDHLGSTSLITNLDGEIVQHVEYVPFGEVFIEERNNKWNTPYLFNAKELDEETGLYYYGARYYEPRISQWMSADPMQEKYPGVSSYAYCGNNPVRFIDPDGNGPVPAAPSYLIGTPAYYEWRYNDMRNRNGGVPPQYHYYMNYGYKYALRFQNETVNEVSNRGKRWLGEVMVNLQKAMEERLSKRDGTTFELDEQAFNNFAFVSHREAYWNKDGSTPLYTLNTVDLFSIVLTPNLKDLLSSEGRTQALDIMGRLAGYWSENLKVGGKRAAEFLLNLPKIQGMIRDKAIREGIDPDKAVNTLLEDFRKHLPTISTDK
jgi:RHS repeat-associated protein